MSDGRGPLESFWPRHGVMSSEAGRRVTSGVLVLTARAFTIAAALLGVIYLGAIALDLLDPAVVRHLAVGMVGGLASVGIAFALLPALGRLSRLGDDVRLLELCDPGAPLLRTLMDVAPGTFQHSITAGTLAEAAARAIGADPLLARVGGYYHDIGKSARPQFFAENQAGVRNPHDTARPEQSAIIITAHVREGVEMARRARLPEPVIAIIGQHHGTSLVTYFYRKAAEACDIAVDESGFRYEGEKPRTREAAIVMLADASEAVGRCVADSGAAAIEKAVRKVVRGKVVDDQLAGSGMTEADIEATVVVFARMLGGMRHARVEYPEDAGEGGDDAGAGDLEP